MKIDRLLLVSGIVFSTSVFANSSELSINITGTNLAELMNLKITSLAKKKQDLNEAAAAVYVLTHDEIQRLGVTRIADALRYVPGVEVAQQDAGRWAVSIRGFNDRAANKLLVMIDGRSIYSPLFSGVLWEEKDVLLSNVDRIEVIRGPGGAIWGANAVNGIINIITKNANDTQGTYFEYGSGNGQKQLVQARAGWQLGSDSAMRVYVKHREHDAFASSLNDTNQHSQLGFRVDYSLGKDNQLIARGDAYEGKIGKFDPQDLPDGQRWSGGNLMLIWQITGSKGAQHKVKGYYDRTLLELPTLTDSRKIWNVNYQYQNQWQRHEVVAGVGYRAINDNVQFLPINYIQPQKQSQGIYQTFIQDDIHLSDKLHFILGTKFEHNDFTGNEWQPSLRMSYKFVDSFVWAAWSKSVRVPTRLEKDLYFPGFTGELLDSETAKVAELGWRISSEYWWLDITAYQAKYDQLVSVESYGYGNGTFGDVKGIELSSSVQLAKNWLVRANMSHATMSIDQRESSLAIGSSSLREGRMPKNMAQLGSLWDVNEDWQFNVYLRYVDEMKERSIDSYWTYDATINWQASSKFSLALVMRNLKKHQEWQSDVNVKNDLLLTLRWQL